MNLCAWIWFARPAHTIFSSIASFRHWRHSLNSFIYSFNHPFTITPALLESIAMQNTAWGIQALAHRMSVLPVYQLTLVVLTFSFTRPHSFQPDKALQFITSPRDVSGVRWNSGMRRISPADIVDISVAISPDLSVRHSVRAKLLITAVVVSLWHSLHVMSATGQIDQGGYSVYLQLGQGNWVGLLAACILTWTLCCLKLAAASSSVG